MYFHLLPELAGFCQTRRDVHKMRFCELVSFGMGDDFAGSAGSL